MMSESHRVVVAGLLVGALTLAASGLRFGNRESAAMGVDGHIDSALSTAARPVTHHASADDPQNAGIARVLQAVRRASAIPIPMARAVRRAAARSL